MNFGIIISYVIAGFLMVTILTVTYNVGFSNQEITTTLMKKTHSQTVQEILINDIPKIGYQKNDTIENEFIKAEQHELSYYSDLDNDGSIEQVTWKFDPDHTPDQAQNPHVNSLSRIVDGDQTNINLGITAFEFRYYDTYGSSTPMSFPISDYDDIVQIEIEMELQSDFSLDYRTSDSENFVTTNWRKRFSPVNLRPN